MTAVRYRWLVFVLLGLLALAGAERRPLPTAAQGDGVQRWEPIASRVGPPATVKSAASDSAGDDGIGAVGVPGKAWRPARGQGTSRGLTPPFLAPAPRSHARIAARWARAPPGT